VICCKKMCINNFKANESRMKHLQDTWFSTVQNISAIYPAT
jgi:hypothetical protein